MTVQHGEPNTRVVEEFIPEDIGAPFKIILRNAVRVEFDSSGNQTGYSIPNLRGLERSIVLARSLHPRKLSGAELRFMRKLVSVKQKDLASSVLLTPEYVSNVEAGRNVLSPSSEKLARLYLAKVAIKLQRQTKSDIEAKLENALDTIFDSLVTIPVSDISSEIVFCFTHEPIVRQLKPANDTELLDGWREPAAVCN